MKDYIEFLKDKMAISHQTGFEVKADELTPSLYPHVKDTVRWAISGGCRAIFSSFGMQKTVTQLEILRVILNRTGGKGLIVCPKRVVVEFLTQAEKHLGMKVNYVRIMTMKREPSISEQQAREIVERMGRRESRSEKPMDDFYWNIGLDPELLAQPGKTVTKKAETATADEPSGETPEDIAVPQKRVSSKQRRLSLDEYRTAYLQVPKITDRKPVFVSGEVRDRLDGIVRRLGGRGMSASGLIENLARLHLETYKEDIEQWRKL